MKGCWRFIAVKSAAARLEILDRRTAGADVKSRGGKNE